MTDSIETTELRDTIRTVLDDRRGGVYSIPDEGGAGFDADLWAHFAELGWLALPVPEADGGLSLGMRHLGVLYEELGRDLCSLPVLPTMMAADALSRHGNEPAMLGRIAAGTLRAAFALPDTHDALVDKDGTLSGTVRDVAFADVADTLFLPVKRGDDLALAVIPADAHGVTVAPRPLVDLTRTAADVTVRGLSPDGVTILEPGTDGWAALLDHAAIGLAADAVGGAHALFALTLEYLKTREQFGRAIGSFQALKHRAADWKAAIEAMTAHVRDAAARVERAELDASAAASGAQALACQTYEAFAADAVQLHGGIGFTWEHPCHLFLKRANLAKRLFGSVSDHRDRVARLAFAGMGANSKQDAAPEREPA